MTARIAPSGPGWERPPRVSKPVGRSSMPFMGHTTASTRALTALLATVPLATSVRWALESREPCRSSPRRNRRPLGTFTAGMVLSSTAPPLRYPSLICLPLTTSLPFVQQETVSPPTATTRLTTGAFVTQVLSVKTTTSPRRTSPPSIRWASTRSPMAMVGVIELVGTVYGR